PAAEILGGVLGGELQVGAGRGGRAGPRHRAGLLGCGGPAACRQGQSQNRHAQDRSHRLLLRTSLEPATGEAEVWFPGHNPLRALGIFRRLRQMDGNTSALGFAASQPIDPTCDADVLPRFAAMLLPLVLTSAPAPA